jgi:putative transposase
VESFNGRFREECLNVSWFLNLFDAQRQIESRRTTHNRAQPLLTLDYLTPEELALTHANAGSFKDNMGSSGILVA